MPSRPPVACGRPGCGGLVRDGVCSLCGPRRRLSRRQHDEQRGTSAQRGYGGRWQRLREMVLRDRPYCARCHAEGRVVMATDVHHIVAKRNGGQDIQSNLEPLCHSCHSRVTAQGG